MKLTFIVLAILCLTAQHIFGKVADEIYLKKQKNVYQLFWHVDQPTVYFPELAPIAHDFDITKHIDEYDDKNAVNEFINMKNDMLPRGYMFTVMDPDVRHQTVVLFRVLYSAKTFDLFYKTAVWARFNVNEYMFVYTLSTAVIQRQDTRYIKIPPMYEVLPHFFFDNEVIQKAYSIAMGDNSSATVVVTGNTIVHRIPANYSGWFVQRHNIPENKLSYFTEDVGLNAFYFLINHEFPFFMTGNETSFAQARGDYYFFVHRQLLARYYLERLSHNMGEINYVSLNNPIEIGFYPTMHFRNGFSFPHRETGSHLTTTDEDSLQTIKDLHTRISTAIDVGYVLDKNGERVNIYTKKGLNILGNIVQGYGSHSKVKYQFVPSALEIYCTSMRDPMFFSLYKNILSYYHSYKENLPKYTREELNFPGVKIESVKVTNLSTYFDDFDSLLSNGVSIRNQEEANKMLIIARQKRLNHEAFSYHITVNSDTKTKATVHVFLGPKYDEFGYEVDLQRHYMNFVLLDKWHVDLQAGSHTINRDSRDFSFAVPDEASSHVYYERITSALENRGSFEYSVHPYGFPMRLQLPKGKKGGMPYQLFVMLSPFDEVNAYKWNSPVRGTFIVDNHPMGFPLDRPIDPLHFFVPNMHFKDVTVYHEHLETPST
ncbi:unnamed protein product [Xylocopa violacea]|uniref:Hexamerin n=1 Tax=Xylocopa violacea TaxID=135666 RepID=A0ABP1NQF6_XYLVO